MKTKTGIKTKLFGFALVLGMIALISAFAMSSAFASTTESQGVANGVETAIGDTGLTLYGDKKAIAETDFQIYSDEYITVVINTSGWTLYGSNKNVSVYTHVENLEIGDLTINDLYIGTQDLDNVEVSIKDGSNAVIKSIYIGSFGNTPNSTNKDTLPSVSLTGTGALRFKTFKCYVAMLTINGPKLYGDQSKPEQNDSANSQTLYSNENVTLEKGSLQIETNNKWGIAIADKKTLYIKDNFNLFVSAAETAMSFEYEDGATGKIDCTEGSLKGSASKLTYKERGNATEDAKLSLQGDVDAVYLCVGSSYAKTAYHKGNAELESIAVASLPVKTEYALGEAFDKTGLTITKTYNNGATEEAIPEDSEISGFDSSTPGEKTVTVTCSDSLESNATVSTSFTVTVKDSTNTNAGGGAASGSTQTGDFNFALIAFLLSIIGAAILINRKCIKGVQNAQN